MRMLRVRLRPSARVVLRLFSAPPARLLALPPADSQQRGGKQGDVRHKQLDATALAQKLHAQEEQREVRNQHDPALPANRQAPTPAVSLRREPIAMLRLAHALIVRP